jgi:PAS domain S-box-containing protein
MAERLRAHDWAATPLGPIEGWPQSLRSAVGFMLAARQPVYMVWSAELTSLYNDAFIPILGAKHPAGLGKPYAELWAEIWEEFRPIAEATMAGEAQHFEDRPLPLAARPGLPMSWFTFSLTPLRDGAGAVGGFLGVATETTAKVLAERALRARSEQDLRRSRTEAERQRRLYEAILSNTPDLAYVFDLDHRFIYANEGLLRMWGRSWEEAIGKTCLELGYPDWHAAMHDREIEKVVATKQPIRGEVPFTGTFGRRIYDYIFVPVIGADGEVEAVAGTTRDVTEREESEAALRESEERLRLVVENARDYAIFTTDPEGRIETWWTGAEAVFGWSAGEAVGQPAAITFTPEDRAAGAVEWEMGTARAEGRAPDVRWHFRKDGSRVFIEGSMAALRGPDGELRGFLKIGQDVTARRAAEERQALLSREVDHRAKNALAVVQAMLRLTRAEDVPSFTRAVEGRVAALARAQTLLAEGNWDGADLQALLRSELAPFLGEERAELEGPRLVLSPAAAQAIAMAVHELATNAAKHGALSVQEGRVQVSWRLAGDLLDLLRLRWTERGGPAVAGAPSHRGFGMRVLEGTVRAQLGGVVTLLWQGAGLACELEVPLLRRMGSPERVEDGEDRPEA